MAVTRVTSFAATATGDVIANTACRVSSITVDQPTDGTSANTFLAVYNSATAATAGTDTPVVVIELFKVSATGTKGKHKYVFPGGGYRLDTGCSVKITTTFNGATGVSSTTAPSAYDVFYDIGN